MDVVTAPRGEPVNYSLDLGQQPVNPIAQIGEQTAQAVGEAAARKQAFRINEINNQKAMELARWQHESQMALQQANSRMQIERGMIRYHQMMDVAGLKEAAQERMQKEGESLKNIYNKENFYTKSLGGAPISRKEGESDPQYSARLDDAIKQKYFANTEADAEKYVSLQVNKQLAQRQYDQAANDPSVAALQHAATLYGENTAQKLADEAFSKQYGQTFGEAVKSDPANAQQYSKDYYANLTYYKSVNTAQYLKALGGQGNPVAARLAQYKMQIADYDQQSKELGTMPGDNGRIVPKVWGSDFYNRGQEILRGDAKDADGKLTIDRIAPAGYRQAFLGSGPVAAPQGAPAASAGGGNVVSPPIARPNPDQYPAGVVGPQSPVAMPNPSQYPAGAAGPQVSGTPVVQPAASNSPVTLDNNGVIGVVANAFRPDNVHDWLASKINLGGNLPQAPQLPPVNWPAVGSNFVNRPIIGNGQPTVTPPVDMTHRVMLLGSPGNDPNADMAIAQQIFSLAGMDPRRADTINARQIYLANPSAFASMQGQAQVTPPIGGGASLHDVGTAVGGWMFGNGGAAPALPARVAAPSPVMMAPTPNPTQFAPGAVGPQSPVMQMQPIPVGPGANISPLSFIPTSQPVPGGAYGNPFGDVGAALQQQDTMDYMYGR